MRRFIYKNIENKLECSINLLQNFEKIITDNEFRKELFKEVAKVNENGDNSLHCMAKTGNLEACSFIIAIGKMAKIGNLDACKSLIDIKMTSKTNNLKLTPLHYAARNGHLKVC